MTHAAHRLCRHAAVRGADAARAGSARRIPWSGCSRSLIVPPAAAAPSSPVPSSSSPCSSALPLSQPARLDSAEQCAQLTSWAPDLLVVVAYGLILPPAVLALPPLGCINLHASLLPRWRGAAPIQHAILAGDAQTGVSIMRMRGRLWIPARYWRRSACRSMRRPRQRTCSEQLAQLGAQLLLPTLEAMQAGHAHAQDAVRAGCDLCAQDRQATGTHRLEPWMRRASPGRCVPSIPGRSPHHVARNAAAHLGGAGRRGARARGARARHRAGPGG